MTKDREEQLKKYLYKFAGKMSETALAYGPSFGEKTKQVDDIVDEAVNEIAKMLL